MKNMRFRALTLLIAPIFALNLFVSVPANSVYAQFKEIPKETKLKLKSGNGLILGFINPKNFSINHSVNMQFVSSGNSSLSLASYTATLNYQFLKNLNVSADVTMQYSPYASLGLNNSVLDKDYQKSFNGINLSRVSLQYRPAENMFINIDYIDNSNLYLYDNYYYNRFWDYYR
jgi:hypothetical protein